MLQWTEYADAASQRHEQVRVVLSQDGYPDAPEPPEHSDDQQQQIVTRGFAVSEGQPGRHSHGYGTHQHAPLHGRSNEAIAVAAYEYYLADANKLENTA